MLTAKLGQRNNRQCYVMSGYAMQCFAMLCCIFVRASFRNWIDYDNEFVSRIVRMWRQSIHMVLRLHPPSHFNVLYLTIQDVRRTSRFFQRPSHTAWSTPPCVVYCIVLYCIVVNQELNCTELRWTELHCTYMMRYDSLWYDWLYINKKYAPDSLHGTSCK